MITGGTDCTLLLSSARNLPKIPRAASDKYSAEIPAMLYRVDLQMAKRDDLRRLIGSNPVAMMKANHRNHADFMADVFRYSSFGLLSQVIVWVYRSYHHHGFSYDYFPLELDAWREAISLSLDKPSVDAVDLIYCWMIDHHAVIIEAAEKENFSFCESPDKTTCATTLQHLLKGDYLACVALMKTCVHDVPSLIDFYSGVMQTSLYEVGRLWENGQINVAEEHLATAVAERVITTAYITISGSASLVENGKSVILTTTPNEPHGIGTRMLADILELLGWDVHFLGVNVPIKDVIALVRRVQPTFIGISLMMPYNLHNVETLVSELRSSLATSQRIMVGSPILIWDEYLWRQLDADAYAPDLRTALTIAAEWCSRPCSS